ncbi:Trafficking protein particle complex subunit 9 [Branchiostoma belcheri]|nr:Trafficking protein particle complex subunit 9 [Branchiostoma belcheri]
MVQSACGDRLLCPPLVPYSSTRVTPYSSICGPKRGPSVRYSSCIIIMATASQQTNVKTVPPRFYQDRSYRHGFHGAVSDLQKAEVLQDVVLEVEGRRFPYHRLVLSAASPYSLDAKLVSGR